VKLSFVVPGDPVPKGRPRASVLRGGRTGGRRGPSVVMRTPDATRRYEATVATCARVAAASEAFATVDEPCVLVVKFLLPRPAKLLKARSPAKRVPHPVSLDGDNLLKAIADGLQLGGVLANDSRVVVWMGTKAYVARGEEPHAEVTLATLDYVAELLVDVGCEVVGWSAWTRDA
jgi:Holliday junction resolvase RusA-like endonuclease